ncbi:DUF2971 domain-containing protein [Aeromonas media]|uniref:DUF2971 domain-containing protein n=1 Tax=Aeromonas media TaxID=651 RepID=UPI003D210F08
MRKLYKYFSNLDVDYFSNPSFKLASANTLNDPFETVLAKELLTALELVTDKQSPSYKMFKRMFGEEAKLEQSYDTLFKMCGIISLSETQHNLLMWAHYANQHKGLCVGYSSDVLDNVKFPRFVKIPVNKKPVKINYDSKKIFDFEYDLDYSTDNDLFKTALYKVLTTKGDDWIYEKEHRIILPMNVADRLLVLKGGRVETEHEYYKDFDRRYIEKNKIEGFKISDATKPNHLYLLDIDPIHITDVYIGCKMSKVKATKLKESISSNPKTKHIKVFRFKESQERFELEIDTEFNKD